MDIVIIFVIYNYLLVSFFYGGLILIGDDGYLFNVVISRGNFIVVKFNCDLQEEFCYEYEDSNVMNNFMVVEFIELEGGYLLYGMVKVFDGFGVFYVCWINKVGEI